ncbi:hypothetical protein M413DRAFT_442857 [Hebeloma cylindrosporum]|uniref:LYC1 C-terminal domain-containing protein n=1 Tax=Hebeloma cylindrosporum TaxID=76867 RepID=A0A0C3CL83_HEBCY|nr:hypothetical protein M413DRAFT_442857 [Hebeloma cylindrosporum h7]
MVSLPVSRLSIFPANTAQVLESRKRTFQEWGRGMTLEEYLARDTISDKHEVSRDSRLITWVLAPHDSPGSLDFLCSCETFRRDGLVLKNARPEPANCYGVASVFTPPKHRRRGYAKHMMSLLHWVIAPEESLPTEFPTEWGNRPQRVPGVTPGAFSVLYSDVGPKFYRLCGTLPNQDDGWIVDGPTTTCFNVLKTHEILSSRKKEGRLVWRWLDEASVREAWNEDVSYMEEEMSHSSNCPKPVQFTFLPNKGVAEFQYLRRQYFWEKMDPKPVYWGLCASSSVKASPDPTTFVSWTLDVRPPRSNKLIITRLRVHPDRLQELILEITAFAMKHSVETIEVWNLAKSLLDVSQHLGGTTFFREDHLPCFKWYGSENPEDIAWLWNEKFCWC